jgi:hypothetical protein
VRDADVDTSPWAGEHHTDKGKGGCIAPDNHTEVVGEGWRHQDDWLGRKLVARNVVEDVAGKDEDSEDS